MKLKESLLEYCAQHVQDRITRLKAELANIQASANVETKSSAGDKYETGRAMAQQEMELILRQLAEAEKQAAEVARIGGLRKTDIVGPGSVVTTSQGAFFLAIPVGEVALDQHTIFVISPASPLGQHMMGKRVGELVRWNIRTYDILAID
ncbi:MAG: GreA/GreB family elongation factor [Cytophagales bacterium]|nr:GreA/GreB family elongation factor [Cytophagales bacterium]